MKKKFGGITSVLLIIVSIHVNAQTKSVKDLATGFLDTIQMYSIVSHELNWESVRPAFFEKIKDVQSLNDLYPHFKNFVKTLKDRHSDILFKEIDDEVEDDSDMEEYYARLTDKEAGLPPKEYAHYMIENRYAYIKVPFVVLEQRAYVDTIGAQLLLLDKQNPEAWIIDLTGNDGGAITPMIWQFASLIDQTETFSFIDNRGNEEYQRKIFDQVKNKDKRYYELVKLQYDSVKPVLLKNTKVPVVILTSNITSSSAEFFVACFKGQENVTVIGQTTSGQTSGNETFSLNNNYMLNLTTTLVKDRTGKVYKIGEGIAPDKKFDIGLNIKAPFKQRYKHVIDSKELYIREAVLFLNSMRTETLKR
ncbi:S41 family peptidase [Gynurincola endophyticus]|uniref:S41 family peptidase n=1 Tax=Gynurincola endophyticus TaxID=2479004 RepID=UPI000F8DD370|nr:S41 family peptidase [Gynurincola endophyticus]